MNILLWQEITSKVKKKPEGKEVAQKEWNIAILKINFKDQ